MLQNDLNEIYKLATVNNMQFNSGKFEHLRYGTADNGQESSSPHVTCHRIWNLKLSVAYIMA